jgi:hypothetical protein
VFHHCCRRCRSCRFFEGYVGWAKAMLQFLVVSDKYVASCLILPSSFSMATCACHLSLLLRQPGSLVRTGERSLYAVNSGRWQSSLFQQPFLTRRPFLRFVSTISESSLLATCSPSQATVILDLFDGFSIGQKMSLWRDLCVGSFSVGLQMYLFRSGYAGSLGRVTDEQKQSRTAWVWM